MAVVNGGVLVRRWTCMSSSPSPSATCVPSSSVVLVVPSIRFVSIHTFSAVQYSSSSPKTQDLLRHVYLLFFALYALSSLGESVL